MGKEEMKNKISMALKDPVLQIGFEIICKNLSELEKENATLKELCMLRKMRIEDLEEQIKQMKCCGNCGQWYYGYYCPYCNGGTSK